MPKDWTPHQRTEMAGHVAYEVAAMRAARAEYDRTEDRFAAEAFLLHARVLAEFFWRKKKAKHPKDCRASDFVDRQAWGSKRASLDKQVLKRNGDQVNRQLHHLSWDRIDSGSRNEWSHWVSEFAPIEAAILDAWRLFTGVLTDDEAAVFGEAYNSKCQELEIPT